MAERFQATKKMIEREIERLQRSRRRRQRKRDY
jgi:hypothetical protein